MPPDGTTQAQHQSQEMVKPNCTITGRHDAVLSRLAERRYASRSEALRAAIDYLENSISTEGESTTERLISEIVQLQSQVESLEEHLDDIQESQPGSQLTVARENLDTPSEVADAVNSASSNSIEDVRNKLYSTLSNCGPMTVSELSTESNLEEVSVHQGVESLVADGMITSTDEENPRFRINLPNQ